MWKGTCNKYLLYTNQLKRAENDEYVCMIESILGVIIEHWSEETVYNVLYEDFGCRLDDLESTVDKDLILYSYKDALNYLVLKYNIESFIYILEEIKYWDIEVISISTNEETLTNEQVKEQMLQWATERSL